MLRTALEFLIRRAGTIDINHCEVRGGRTVVGGEEAPHQHLSYGGTQRFAEQFVALAELYGVLGVLSHNSTLRAGRSSCAMVPR